MTKKKLVEVFGIGVGSSTPAYVDRGALDEKFRDSLAANRHVSVHGGSKQGKTWLRKRSLDPSEAVVVQCTITSTAASVLEEALSQLGVRATLSRTETGNLGGHIDVSATATGKAGLPFLAKASAELGIEVGLTGERGFEEQEKVLGQTVANLHWVAASINASSKQLVLEDFHYLPEPEQRIFASWMKALGEYGCHAVIIGVWAQSHLLTYFNGDLDGRVDDIHLKWEDDELRTVLRRGATALEIKFTNALVDAIVADAYGNVGLVHRLALSLLKLEKVDELPAWTLVDVSDKLTVARAAVADQMSGRFDTFASNFVGGMRRMSEGLVVYLHLLRAITASDDASLVGQGVDARTLLANIGSDGIRLSDLTQALERIDRLQVKIDISPPVLTYHRAGKRVQLVDRSFLFYRRYGNPTWPWDDDEDIQNDLSGAAPLDIFED
ncbi:hypothetical protein [Microbacterium gorillae]|uniref:hypothetical protein n=1 Tax=Microbacterium gorillae TaxID=1231063 RepID=UPI00058D34D7|nr:hypothetical protein [Microbacterium gorillae]